MNTRLTGRVAALLSGVLLVAAVAMLFRDAYVGPLSILGIDSSYGTRILLKRALEQGQGGLWVPFYWLGMGQGAMGLRTSFLFERIFPTRTALAASYTASILLAMGLTYGLLRRFRLRPWAAALGAVAYGLTPHFVSLVYAGHISVVSFLPFLPGTFLFLTLLMADNTRPCTRTVGALLAGVCAGMMINEDPQRGLYGSLAAAAYVAWFMLSGSAPDATPDQPGVPAKVPRRFIRLLPLLALAMAIALAVAARGIQSQIGAGYLTGGRAGVSDSGAERSHQVWEFATGWSLHPAELVDSLAPGYHGWLSGHAERPYWGTKPVSHNSDALGYFVALWAVVGMVMGYRRHGVVRFMTWTAAAATLLACGKYLPGKPLFWLWLKLPLMDRFRVPLKFMAVTAFALAVLAAYGLDIYLAAVAENRARRPTRALVVTLSFLLAVGLLAAAGVGLGMSAVGRGIAQTHFGGSPELGGRAAWNVFLALARMCGFTVLTLALILASARPRLKTAFLKWGGTVATLLAVVDLYSIDRFYVANALFRHDQMFAPDGVIRFLQDDHDRFRVTTSLKLIYKEQVVPLSLTAIEGHYLTYLFPYFGIEAMDNLPSGRVAADYAAFFRAVLGPVPLSGSPELIDRLIRSNLRLWELSNVKYIVTDGFLYGIGPNPVPVYETLSKQSALELIHVTDGSRGRKHAVFRMKGHRARYTFFSRVAMATNETTALDYVADPAHDLTRLPVVTTPVPLATGNDTTPLPVALTGRPEVLTLTNDAPGVLVAAVKYDPAWRAEVNGVRTPMLPANYLMRALPLAPGCHTVTFAYAPDARAFIVSIGTLTGALVLAACLSLLSLCAWRKEKR